MESNPKGIIKVLAPVMFFIDVAIRFLQQERNTIKENLQLSVPLRKIVAPRLFYFQFDGNGTKILLTAFTESAIQSPQKSKFLSANPRGI